MHIYTKGTDAVNIPHYSIHTPHSCSLIPQSHTHTFAKDRLHTLIVGWKDIPCDAVFSAWEQSYSDAQNTLNDPQLRIENVATMLEHALHLI